MSISGVSSSSGFDVSKMASQFFKKTDTNGDGSVDKAEFTKSLTDKGISEEDATKKFDSIDKNKTGKISESDIESDMKSMQNSKKSDGTSTEKASSSGGKGTSSASGSSSTSKTYDKADTNKDGKVSTEEQLVYDLKKLQEAQAKAAKASAPTSTPDESSQSTSSNQSSQIGQNIDVTV